VPGSSERKLEKAAGVPADELVLDLEDAVAVDAKEVARAAVAAALTVGALSGHALAVRVNARGTPWFAEDLMMLGGVERRPLSVVIPKVEAATDLAAATELLEEAEAGVAGQPVRLQALIETAAGVARVDEIAASSERLDALVLGYADLATSLGRAHAAARDPGKWIAVQDAILIAARSNDLQAIDGPWLGIAVDDPFLSAARHARDLGFDGKWAIHPAQVEALNELFTPSEKEVTWARDVLAALDGARRAGEGAMALDGEMLDEALAAAAVRVLARAEGVGRPALR
jgi:citrate lyase subunit beta/citryl-CoA lyase